MSACNPREAFDRCDNCGDAANAGGDAAWYIMQYGDPDRIRGVLCESCSHAVGHGLERGDDDG